MQDFVMNAMYLVASVLFLMGIKGLTHPRTAVRGNMLGALGMLLAVVVTIYCSDLAGWGWVVAGLVVGTGIGVYMAHVVPMTGMPQMVGLFNGFGGLASFLVAGGELMIHLHSHAAQATEAAAATGGDAHVNYVFWVALALSGLIGSVTLSGSVVAAGKLAEKTFTIGGKKYWLSDAILLPNRNLINAAVFLLSVLLCVLVVRAGAYGGEGATAWYWILVLLAAVLGILITIPIGGADMPVVIALLNSYSGLAGCATGFVIENNVLIIAGSLVGASGLILTGIMCKAMNRSLANVVFATFGPSSSGPSADDIYAGKIKATSAEEVAMLFDGAQRVVIVPGYGMAVSQAQHAVRDLGNMLEQNGSEVEYAIHPVAGRMPGHMNVLLAEADVPYDKLKEMDEINPTLDQVDVAIVVGANDVVNPVARTDPDSPIAGMPIIDVDKCRTVVVVKRSLSPGFAKIPNPLFAMDNTLMFFSDAKKAFVEMTNAVKENM